MAAVPVNPVTLKEKQQLAALHFLVLNLGGASENIIFISTVLVQRQKITCFVSNFSVGGSLA